ncbi:unnamed protein product [Amoebophrya sp. A120]|nr:unnamed protein product [Amoebophrya sp. A120]|eukprot:GSA120T00003514001.1
MIGSCCFPMQQSGCNAPVLCMRQSLGEGMHCLCKRCKTVGTMGTAPPIINFGTMTASSCCQHDSFVNVPLEKCIALRNMQDNLHTPWGPSTVVYTQTPTCGATEQCCRKMPMPAPPVITAPATQTQTAPHKHTSTNLSRSNHSHAVFPATPASSAGTTSDKHTKAEDATMSHANLPGRNEVKQVIREAYLLNTRTTSKQVQKMLWNRFHIRGHQIRGILRDTVGQCLLALRPRNRQGQPNAPAQGAARERSPRRTQRTAASPPAGSTVGQNTGSTNSGRAETTNTAPAVDKTAPGNNVASSSAAAASSSAPGPSTVTMHKPTSSQQSSGARSNNINKAATARPELADLQKLLDEYDPWVAPEEITSQLWVRLRLRSHDCKRLFGKTITEFLAERQTQPTEAEKQTIRDVAKSILDQQPGLPQIEWLQEIEKVTKAKPQLVKLAHGCRVDQLYRKLTNQQFLKSAGVGNQLNAKEPCTGYQRTGVCPKGGPPACSKDHNVPLLLAKPGVATQPVGDLLDGQQLPTAGLSKKGKTIFASEKVASAAADRAAASGAASSTSAAATGGAAHAEKAYLICASDTVHYNSIDALYELHVREGGQMNKETFSTKVEAGIKETAHPKSARTSDVELQGAAHALGVTIRFWGAVGGGVFDDSQRKYDRSTCDVKIIAPKDRGLLGAAYQILILPNGRLRALL